MKLPSTRQWIRLFFSFMATLLTAVLVLACVCVATVFSESYLVRQMEETDYYAHTASVLRDQYAAYGLPAGVEDAFFDTVIDQDALYRHIREAVRAAYAGESYTLDKQTLTDSLSEKLQAYATEKNIALTDDVKEGLTYLSDLCVSAYNKQVNHVLVRTLGRYAHRLLPYMWVAIGILTVLDGICLWMVYRLSSMPHRAVRFWNSGFLGAAIMVIALPGWLYLSKGVDKLGITSLSLKPLVVAYANHIFTSLVISGVVIMVTVLTVGTITARLLNRHTYFKR